MIRSLIEAAWRLDQWLKDKVGRLYTLVLMFALVAGISANARALVQDVRSAGNIVVIALTVALYLILLINQLAQLHEYRQAARERRDARKQGRKAG